MLSVKVSDIIDGIEFTLGSLSVSKVHAQVSAPLTVDPNSKILDGKDKNIFKDKLDFSKEKAKNSANSLVNDPTLYTQKEIDLLLQLAERRKIVEARSRELTLREGILGAAEKRIDKKIKEMKRLKAALQKVIKAKRK